MPALRIPNANSSDANVPAKRLQGQREVLRLRRVDVERGVTGVQRFLIDRRAVRDHHEACQHDREDRAHDDVGPNHRQVAGSRTFVDDR